MIKRLSVIGLLVGTGLVAGLVLSGRADDRTEILTRPVPAPAEQPAAIPATPATLAAPAASQAPVSAGPDFRRVAARTVKAVTNISSVQVVRRTASPFANDPFFQ